VHIVSICGGKMAENDLDSFWDIASQVAHPPPLLHHSMNFLIPFYLSYQTEIFFPPDRQPTMTSTTHCIYRQQMGIKRW
jgi:hypothetical protein